MMTAVNGTTKTQGYAPVNGLRMYYEIEGTGEPLVYIGPALSCVGLNSFPALVERHSLVTLDLQGHGRTADVAARPLSIEQYADDVVGLLRYLGITRADFFGESYGGAVAVMIAVRHRDLVNRVATYGATFGPPDVAHNREMLRFDEPPTPDAPAFEFQRNAYRRVAPDPAEWGAFWNKLASLQWNGFSNEELASTAAPVLIALGDRDFVRLDHAVETMKRIPNAELAVIPDAGHFALFSEQQRVIPIVQYFLEKPARRPPVATAGMGYRPGETR